MANKVTINGLDIWAPDGNLFTSIHAPEYSYYPSPVYNASGRDDMFHNIEIENEHARSMQNLLESGELTTEDLELVLAQFKLKRVEQILSGKILKGKSFTGTSVEKAIADYEVEKLLKERYDDKSK